MIFAAGHASGSPCVAADAASLERQLPHKEQHSYQGGGHQVLAIAIDYLTKRVIAHYSGGVKVSYLNGPLQLPRFTPRHLLHDAFAVAV